MTLSQPTGEAIARDLRPLRRYIDLHHPYEGLSHLTDMRSCYSGLQSEGPPRDEHNSDTKRGVASAMKPPDKNISQHVIL